MANELMKNEITIISNGQFKSKALNTATAGLYKAFQSVENGKKDACAILAKVEANKTYKDDGFSSLAEYGAAIGIGDKSLIHKMENAGRLLISEDPVVKAFADKTDYSKLTILSSANQEELKQAIESGEVTPNMTQDKVKSWKATKALQSKPEKVVTNWKLSITAYHAVDPTSGHFVMIPEERTVGISDPVDFAREYDDTALVSKVRDAEGNPIYLCICADGSMFNYTAEKVKKERKPKVKSEKNMTKEDLMRIAEAMGVKISFGDADE